MNNEWKANILIEYAKSLKENAETSDHTGYIYSHEPYDKNTSYKLYDSMKSVTEAVLQEFGIYDNNSGILSVVHEPITRAPVEINKVTVDPATDIYVDSEMDVITKNPKEVEPIDKWDTGKEFIKDTSTVYNVCTDIAQRLTDEERRKLFNNVDIHALNEGDRKDAIETCANSIQQSGIPEVLFTNSMGVKDFAEGKANTVNIAVSPLEDYNVTDSLRVEGRQIQESVSNFCKLLDHKLGKSYTITESWSGNKLKGYIYLRYVGNND